jgi:hypothetical protein
MEKKQLSNNKLNIEKKNNIINIDKLYEEINNQIK